jgi:cell wall-associated NlpC family hydrolase
MISMIHHLAEKQTAGLPEQERAERLTVVGEALSWLNTPYHHMGRLKGVGVDCGMFFVEVMEAVGVIDHYVPEAYPPDWHLHRGEQVYRGHVEKLGFVKVEREPLPGDLVLYQFGRCSSHGAIVLAWPYVIHSYVNMGVIYGVNGESPLDADRLTGCWTKWGAV